MSPHIVVEQLHTPPEIALLVLEVAVTELLKPGQGHLDGDIAPTNPLDKRVGAPGIFGDFCQKQEHLILVRPVLREIPVTHGWFLLVNL